jgi:hypothetical protein
VNHVQRCFSIIYVGTDPRADPKGDPPDPAYWEYCKHNHDEYLAAGIRPWLEGSGSNGAIIETRDEPDGGLDAATIDKLIDEALLKFTAC